MSRRQDYLVTLIGLVLVGLGMFLIKAYPDPENIMNSLPEWPAKQEKAV